jgi:hypothetical protein
VLKTFEFGYFNFNLQACKFFGNSSGINVAREICAGMNSIFYHFDQREWKSIAGVVIFALGCKRWLAYVDFFGYFIGGLDCARYLFAYVAHL